MRLAVKPVGEPDAGNPHVRFDERGGEMGRCRMVQATAPLLDSTRARTGKLVSEKAPELVITESIKFAPLHLVLVDHEAVHLHHDRQG